MPEETASRNASGRSLIDRTPSWVFLVGLAVFVLLLWAVTLTGPGNFVDEYIWEPISTTGNYNVVNTILLMIVLGLVLGWIYRLMAELDEKVDLELTVAVVPYLVWGSVYHVLEDADLFAPFAERIRATGGTDLDAACWAAAGGGFLQECFGVFFQTPIIYVVVTFIAVLIFWLGHVAKRISLRRGPQHGLRFVGLMLIGLLALYMALWASEPSYMRFVANPVVAVAAVLVAGFMIWRDTVKRGWVNPRWVMFSFSIIFLIVGMYYVFVWMTNGHADWNPVDARRTTTWWVLVALVVAPWLVAYSTARKGRAFSGGHPEGPYYGARLEKPNKLVWTLMGLVIVEGLAIFASLAAFSSLETQVREGELFSDLGGLVLLIVQLALGPLAILAGNRFAWQLARRGFGVHPGMVFFAFPVNLIMVFGQTSDGLMTSVGIDLFGYEEKHVLPAFLISLVDQLGLPEPFGSYPTTLVMVPLKFLIVLAVVWLIDLGQHQEGTMRQNLVGLVKMAIIMVGLSPGVRDAVRLAMGV